MRSKNIALRFIYIIGRAIEQTFSRNVKIYKANNLWSRISTNLSLDFKENYLEELLKSGLSLIHVDVDGLDQDVYENRKKEILI